MRPSKRKCGKRLAMHAKRDRILVSRRSFATTIWASVASRPTVRADLRDIPKPFAFADAHLCQYGCSHGLTRIKDFHNLKRRAQPLKLAGYKGARRDGRRCFPCATQSRNTKSAGTRPRQCLQNPRKETAGKAGGWVLRKQCTREYGQALAVRFRGVPGHPPAARAGHVDKGMTWTKRPNER